jgi:hypothetical protein
MRTLGGPDHLVPAFAVLCDRARRNYRHTRGLGD